jgi:hypothetical protein
MARTVECPECGLDISDTYEAADPSVGITAGWYCYVCDISISEDERDDEFEADHAIDERKNRE